MEILGEAFTSTVEQRKWNEMACMCLLIARLARVPSTAATISHDVQKKPSCLQHPGEKHTTWLVRLPRHLLATAPLDVCCTRRGGGRLIS